MAQPLCDTLEAVRRFSANLLLALYGLVLIVPAFAGPESELPACCRRSGQHHCTLANDSAGAPSARSVEQHCPCIPQSNVSRTASDRVAIRPSQTVFAFLAGQPFVAAQAEARALAFFSRSRQKRGPPDLLA